MCYLLARPNQSGDWMPLNSVETGCWSKVADGSSSAVTIVATAYMNNSSYPNSEVSTKLPCSGPFSTVSRYAKLFN